MNEKVHYQGDKGMDMEAERQARPVGQKRKTFYCSVWQAMPFVATKMLVRSLLLTGSSGCRCAGDAVRSRKSAFA
jgi:hypothetical protein